MIGSGNATVAPPTGGTEVAVKARIVNLAKTSKFPEQFLFAFSIGGGAFDFSDGNVATKGTAACRG